MRHRRGSRILVPTARLAGLLVAVEPVPTLFDATLYVSPALEPRLQQVLRRHASRAQRKHCDLVLIGSGGEARRLLAHSRIPVLVCR